MEWSDQGLILSVRPQGEYDAVLEVFARSHGRYLGLVKGGRSRRLRPTLQIGNLIEVTWRARLAEHLGNYTVELSQAHAAVLMEEKMALAGLNALCAFIRLLPERDPHPGLYEATLLILDHIRDISIWPGLLVRWEFELLGEMGFGLDLSECAATGSKDNLVYVSPKSGKAVSAEAGEPYKDKLLKLPSLLKKTGQGHIEEADVQDGFALTGYFIEKYILEPRGLEMPEVRNRMIGYLEQASRS